MKKIRMILSVLVILLVLVGISIARDYTPVSAESASTISGARTYTGKVLTTGLVGDTATATSLTNAGVLTATAKTHIISGIGSANDATNAVTIANPTFIGQELKIIVATASTNLISLADSGNLKLTGALVLDADDSVTLTATAAAVWSQTVPLVNN